MRIIRPEGNPAADRRPGFRLSAREQAMRAAIDRRLSRNVRLTCEHLTTLDIQMVYANWSPGKGKMYCEQCGRWVKPKPAVTVKVPDEPLF